MTEIDWQRIEDSMRREQTRRDAWIGAATWIGIIAVTVGLSLWLEALIAGVSP